MTAKKDEERKDEEREDKPRGGMKVKAVRTVHAVPTPNYRPGRNAVDRESVGAIEIINIGVTYICEEVPVIIPWANVKYVELEPKKAKAKGAAAAE